MSVSSFEIDLERASGVYYAGEVVRGTVKLVTTKDIKTRGVRVRYQGLGHMHFHTGSGDNRNDYDGLKVYEEQRYTMFGNYFNTSILYEAGEDANFGSASGDGTMYIPCNENDRLEMIVRVMDFDFGKKDDLLGEIVLNVTDLAAKGNTETFSLQRKGKPEKGNVTLSAKIFPMHALFPASPSNAQGPVSGYSAICELRAHRATGLRKADFIGKNDVYVQAYRVPNSTVDQNKVLPEPDRTTTLPAGTLVFPFAFPIRVDAPGSAEMRVCDWAFIRYNLYANIDIAWWKDPSVKRTITVIASRPLPPPKLLYPIEYKCLEPVLMSTCCCFPWCTRVGSVTLDARLGRQVFASGERLDFSALLHNSTSQQLTVSVEVVCRVFMQTTGMFSHGKHPQVVHGLLSESVAPGDDWRIDGADREVRLPPLFPSFFGAKGMASAQRDPVQFTYELVISAGPQGSCVFRTAVGLPFIVSAVPPSAAAVRQALEEDRPAQSQVTARADNAFELSQHVTEAAQHDLASIAAIAAGSAPSLPQATLVSSGTAISTYSHEEDFAAVVPRERVSYQPHVLTYGAYDPVPLAAAAVVVTLSGAAVQQQRDELIAALGRTSDKRSAVLAWAQAHPAAASTLSPEDLRQVLKSVAFSMDQISVSLELAQCAGRAHLTCAHIVAACECCTFFKTEVAQAMAPYAGDGAANKGRVLCLLPSYDVARVESLFY